MRNNLYKKILEPAFNKKGKKANIKKGVYIYDRNR